jgi:hypothetical protein
VVRVDGRGHLRPAGDGAAQVVVRHGPAEARVAVRVRFRLSLFGSDPAFDHEALVREACGRVFAAAPVQ